MNSVTPNSKQKMVLDTVSLDSLNLKELHILTQGHGFGRRYIDRYRQEALTVSLRPDSSQSLLLLRTPDPADDWYCHFNAILFLTRANLRGDSVILHLAAWTSLSLILWYLLSFVWTPLPTCHHQSPKKYPHKTCCPQIGNKLKLNCSIVGPELNNNSVFWFKCPAIDTSILACTWRVQRHAGRTLQSQSGLPFEVSSSCVEEIAATIVSGWDIKGGTKGSTQEGPAAGYCRQWLLK